MRITIYLLLLFLLNSAVFCKRVSLPDSRWKILEVRLPNATTVQMPTKDYVLQFHADNKVTIKLDVNSCFSEYKIGEPNQISISPLGCTKVCCDSEFAMAMVLALPQMRTYTIKKRKLLVLEGDGRIVLQKME